MTTSKFDKDPVLLYEAEADQFLNSVSDPVIRELMGIAHAEVKHRFQERQGLPSSDFDMLFFLQAVKAFFGKTELLKRILAGEDLAAEYQ